MTKGRLQSILFISDKERGNSFFDSPVFLLLLTLLSSLTRTNLCKFSLLPDIICPQSPLEKLNVLGLWVLTPQWTYPQMPVSQVRAKSLPFPTSKSAIWKTSSVAQQVQYRAGIWYLLVCLSLKWRKSCEKKSAQQCFGQCGVKWHHR